MGGAISNSGEIENIIGDFEGNESDSYGGAIYNSNLISAITGDFIENSASSHGGSIYNNDGTISSITGDFIGNNASSDGGAIYNNDGGISSITGDFIGNNASSDGGAIYNNDGTISSITGDFIGNNASSDGGAIYNNDGTISSITGDFIGNNASSDGGAIYNYDGTINLVALETSIQFTGNSIGSDGLEESNAIYNTGSSGFFGGATINMNAYADASIVVNDGISGSSFIENQVVNINNQTVSGSLFSTVEFNNTVENQTINVYNGTLILGEYAGGVVELSGIDVDNDGFDDTITVDSSSALLSNVVLNIQSTAIVDTKADYLGSSSTVTNNGTLNLNGGILSIDISGTGLINISGDVTISNVTISSSVVNISEDATLNNGGMLEGDIVATASSDVNAIISAVNVGGVIFNGSISGITSIDVSFDTMVDFSEILGTTTTIYVNEADNISLNFTDIDTVSGIDVVGNTVVVGDILCIDSALCTAIIEKDGEAVNITVESGIFEITGEQIQTFDSVSISDSASLLLSGGTLNLLGCVLNKDIDGWGTINIFGDLSLESGVMTLESYSILNNYATLSACLIIEENVSIYNSGVISSITSYSGNNVTSGSGRAIYNSGTIEEIIGSFINNNVTSGSGGAIYNSGTIEEIIGSFINNNVTFGYGGAIYNSGTIENITGDFTENYASTYSYASAGAIYNYRGTIESIIGSFTGNYALYRGGAIYNDYGTIDSITGNFIGNNASSNGGAIYNYYGTIDSITGSFIGNTSLYGGAIYNYYGTIDSITGSFIGNTATVAAAVYNYCGTIEFTALGQDVLIVGNYSSTSGSTTSAILNAGLTSSTATISFNAFDSYQITINDIISGYSSYTSTQILNINQADGATSEVSFNNSVSYQTINVYQGSLNLGEYEGGTITLSGVDADEDGCDDTMDVSASSAFLTKCYLNIESAATVNTKADYLGSTSTITNNGTLNISGGTLSTSIAGAGTMNILGDVTVSSGSMSVVADSTLNNYATLSANLTVEDGASVNAIITTENLGETIFDGSITGITSMDVSFDLSLDFNDVVGTTTTIYANESDGITLTLVDSDHISGASVVGNTVIVEDKIEISTDDYTATVSKDGDSTNIDVTAGSFEIAEGETQTLSNITTGEDATLVITGGTLVTDNDFTLANDEATSGVKAESGVIESTATVQLSEGTTSVASGESLEIKAEVNLADNTQATFGSSDASLILQNDITLGTSSVLTLDGNISGSANIFGDGTATINYTGTFSPGNSPELVSYSDVTVNYTVGSILEMEIFGEAGAGVDGGYDKIVFYGCDVSFDGTIQLNIDDVAALLGDEQSTTIVFDLFDFEDGSTVVSYSGDFELIYDASGWLVVVDTTNLLVTGEVSLSITAIPEPSTATLSLLALAGMLARRRRKAA